MIKDHNLNITNSLTGEKEEFKPINAPNVGMYVCGPTLYSNAHLGNVRTFLFFDVVFRYLKHLGYKVRYVRNITDVGHLLDNEEDKVTKRAKLEQLEPMEVVQKYTVDFHNILNQFNFLPPSIEPSATGHIIEQIELTEKLIKNGLAYEVDGSVYFNVLKYNEKHDYGELSNRKIEDLISNTRALDGQSIKKNPQDFALWKKATPEHIMRWNSPWGEGFPGWHLECTVMSTKYLGEQFEIHGGGMDLKFPHHECEIAQAKGSHGLSPVKYWIHTNMLNMNNEKMSKSTGNYVLPEDLISGDNEFFTKGFSPMVLRFFMLQAHYSSVLNLSDDGILASEKGYQRLMDGIKLLSDLKTSKESSINLKDWEKSCYVAMDDDFNTPILIAKLFEAVKWIQLINDGKETISEKDLVRLTAFLKEIIEDVLGLQIEENASDSGKLDAAMNVLIQLRNQARDNKDWALSDQIRDELANAGIQLKDSKDGTTYSIN